MGLVDHFSADAPKEMRYFKPAYAIGSRKDKKNWVL
jgi:hypothetical protein